MKKQFKTSRIIGACIVCLVHIMIYYFGYILPPEFGKICRSVEWLFRMRLYVVPFMITVVPAVCGAFWFSAITTAGCVLGIAVGEKFGPHPEMAELGFGYMNYSYWTWTFLFSVGVAAAISFAMIIRKRNKIRDR